MASKIDSIIKLLNDWECLKHLNEREIAIIRNELEMLSELAKKDLKDKISKM